MEAKRSPTLWSVHRDASRRAALARLLGARVPAAEGAPDSADFETAPLPDLVLLGVGEDCEAELEFAHRVSARAPEAHWLLLTEPGASERVTALFDTLALEALRWPPAPRELEAKLQELGVEPPAALSARQRRDRLAERFARWLGDLELPGLLLALDPRPPASALRIEGEAGSGRSLLARYVHHFGGRPGEAFHSIDAAVLDDAEALRAALRPPAGAPRPTAATICLERVDALTPALQRRLAEWIELGLPDAPPAARLRWMATLGDASAGGEEAGLEATLSLALAGLVLRIPPLRERPGAVRRMAEAQLAAWAAARREPAPELAASALARLEAHAWLGNARELEAALTRTLASGVGSPIEAEDLRLADADDADPSGVAAAAMHVSAPVPTGHAETQPGAFAAQPSPAAEPAVPSQPEPSDARDEPQVEPPDALAEPQLETPDVPGEPRTAAETLGAPAPQELLDALEAELRAPLADAHRQAERLANPGAGTGERELARRALEDDLLRVERELARSAAITRLATGEPTRVDVTSMLEAELEAHRRIVEARRLLVLKELERAEPFAHAVREPLAIAVRALLDHMLAAVPERGDVYLASRHQPATASQAARLRVVARFHRPEPAAGPSLALLRARLAALRAGGRLQEAKGGADEGIFVLELQAG